MSLHNSILANSRNALKSQLNILSQGSNISHCNNIESIPILTSTRSHFSTVSSKGHTGDKLTDGQIKPKFTEPSTNVKTKDSLSNDFDIPIDIDLVKRNNNATTDKDIVILQPHKIPIEELTTEELRTSLKNTYKAPSHIVYSGFTEQPYDKTITPSSLATSENVDIESLPIPNIISEEHQSTFSSLSLEARKIDLEIRNIYDTVINNGTDCIFEPLVTSPFDLNETDFPKPHTISLTNYNTKLIQNEIDSNDSSFVIKKMVPFLEKYDESVSDFISKCPKTGSISVSFVDKHEIPVNKVLLVTSNGQTYLKDISSNITNEKFVFYVANINDKVIINNRVVILDEIGSDSVVSHWLTAHTVFSSDSMPAISRLNSMVGVDMDQENNNLHNIPIIPNYHTLTSIVSKLLINNDTSSSTLALSLIDTQVRYSSSSDLGILFCNSLLSSSTIDQLSPSQSKPLLSIVSNYHTMRSKRISNIVNQLLLSVSTLSPTLRVHTHQFVNNLVYSLLFSSQSLDLFQQSKSTVLEVNILLSSASDRLKDHHHHRRICEAISYLTVSSDSGFMTLNQALELVNNEVFLSSVDSGNNILVALQELTITVLETLLSSPQGFTLKTVEDYDFSSLHKNIQHLTGDIVVNYVRSTLKGMLALSSYHRLRLRAAQYVKPLLQLTPLTQSYLPLLERVIVLNSVNVPADCSHIDPSHLVSFHWDKLYVSAISDLNCNNIDMLLNNVVMENTSLTEAFPDTTKTIANELSIASYLKDAKLVLPNVSKYLKSIDRMASFFSPSLSQITPFYAALPDTVQSEKITTNVIPITDDYMYRVKLNNETLSNINHDLFYSSVVCAPDLVNIQSFYSPSVMFNHSKFANLLQQLRYADISFGPSLSVCDRMLKTYTLNDTFIKNAIENESSLLQNENKELSPFSDLSIDIIRMSLKMKSIINSSTLYVLQPTYQTLEQKKTDLENNSKTIKSKNSVFYSEYSNFPINLISVIDQFADKNSNYYCSSTYKLLSSDFLLHAAIVSTHTRNLTLLKGILGLSPGLETILLQLSLKHSQTNTYTHLNDGYDNNTVLSRALLVASDAVTFSPSAIKDSYVRYPHPSQGEIPSDLDLIDTSPDISLQNTKNHGQYHDGLFYCQNMIELATGNYTTLGSRFDYNVQSPRDRFSSIDSYGTYTSETNILMSSFLSALFINNQGNRRSIHNILWNDVIDIFVEASEVGFTPNTSISVDDVTSPPCLSDVSKSHIREGPNDKELSTHLYFVHGHALHLYDNISNDFNSYKAYNSVLSVNRTREPQPLVVFGSASDTILTWTRQPLSIIHISDTPICNVHPNSIYSSRDYAKFDQYGNFTINSENQPRVASLLKGRQLKTFMSLTAKSSKINYSQIPILCKFSALEFSRAIVPSPASILYPYQVNSMLRRVVGDSVATINNYDSLDNVSNLIVPSSSVPTVKCQSVEHQVVASSALASYLITGAGITHLHRSADNLPNNLVAALKESNTLKVMQLLKSQVIEKHLRFGPTCGLKFENILSLFIKFNLKSRALDYISLYQQLSAEYNEVFNHYMLKPSSYSHFPYLTQYMYDSIADEITHTYPKMTVKIDTRNTHNNACNLIVPEGILPPTHFDPQFITNKTSLDTPSYPMSCAPNVSVQDYMSALDRSLYSDAYRMKYTDITRIERDNPYSATSAHELPTRDVQVSLADGAHTIDDQLPDHQEDQLQDESINETINDSPPSPDSSVPDTYSIMTYRQWAKMSQNNYTSELTPAKMLVALASPTSAVYKVSLQENLAAAIAMQSMAKHSTDPNISINFSLRANHLQKKSTDSRVNVEAMFDSDMLGHQQTHKGGPWSVYMTHYLSSMLLHFTPDTNMMLKIAQVYSMDGPSNFYMPIFSPLFPKFFNNAVGFKNADNLLQFGQIPTETMNNVVWSNMLKEGILLSTNSMMNTVDYLYRQMVTSPHNVKEGNTVVTSLPDFSRHSKCLQFARTPEFIVTNSANSSYYLKRNHSIKQTSVLNNVTLTNLATTTSETGDAKSDSVSSLTVVNQLHIIHAAKYLLQLISQKVCPPIPLLNKVVNCLEHLPNTDMTVLPPLKNFMYGVNVLRKLRLMDYIERMRDTLSEEDFNAFFSISIDRYGNIDSDYYSDELSHLPYATQSIHPQSLINNYNDEYIGGYPSHTQSFSSIFNDQVVDYSFDPSSTPFFNQTFSESNERYVTDHSVSDYTEKNILLFHKNFNQMEMYYFTKLLNSTKFAKIMLKYSYYRSLKDGNTDKADLIKKQHNLSTDIDTPEQIESLLSVDWNFSLDIDLYDVFTSTPIHLLPATISVDDTHALLYYAVKHANTISTFYSSVRNIFTEWKPRTSLVGNSASNSTYALPVHIASVHVVNCAFSIFMARLHLHSPNFMSDFSDYSNVSSISVNQLNASTLDLSQIVLNIENNQASFNMNKGNLTAVETSQSYSSHTFMNTVITPRAVTGSYDNNAVKKPHQVYVNTTVPPQLSLALSLYSHMFSLFVYSTTQQHVMFADYQYLSNMRVDVVKMMLDRGVNIDRYLTKRFRTFHSSNTVISHLNYPIDVQDSSKIEYANYMIHLVVSILTAFNHHSPLVLYSKLMADIDYSLACYGMLMPGVVEKYIYFTNKFDLHPSSYMYDFDGMYITKEMSTVDEEGHVVEMLPRSPYDSTLHDLVRLYKMLRNLSYTTRVRLKCEWNTKLVFDVKKRITSAKWVGQSMISLNDMINSYICDKIENRLQYGINGNNSNVAIQKYIQTMISTFSGSSDKSNLLGISQKSSSLPDIFSKLALVDAHNTNTMYSKIQYLSLHQFSYLLFGDNNMDPHVFDDSVVTNDLESRLVLFVDLLNNPHKIGKTTNKVDESAKPSTLTPADLSLDYFTHVHTLIMLNHYFIHNTTSLTTSISVLLREAILNTFNALNVSDCDIMQSKTIFWLTEKLINSVSTVDVLSDVPHNTLADSSASVNHSSIDIQLIPVVMKLLVRYNDFTPLLSLSNCPSHLYSSFLTNNAYAKLSLTINVIIQDLALLAISGKKPVSRLTNTQNPIDSENSVLLLCNLARNWNIHILPTITSLIPLCLSNDSHLHVPVSYIDIILKNSLENTHKKSEPPAPLSRTDITNQLTQYYKSLGKVEFYSVPHYSIDLTTPINNTNLSYSSRNFLNISQNMAHCSQLNSYKNIDTFSIGSSLLSKGDVNAGLNMFILHGLIHVNDSVSAELYLNNLLDEIEKQKHVIAGQMGVVLEEYSHIHKQMKMIWNCGKIDYNDSVFSSVPTSTNANTSDAIVEDGSVVQISIFSKSQWVKFSKLLLQVNSADTLFVQYLMSTTLQLHSLSNSTQPDYTDFNSFSFDVLSSVRSCLRQNTSLGVNVKDVIYMQCIYELNKSRMNSSSDLLSGVCCTFEILSTIVDEYNISNINSLSSITQLYHSLTNTNTSTSKTGSDLSVGSDVSSVKSSLINTDTSTPAQQYHVFMSIVSSIMTTHHQLYVSEGSNNSPLYNSANTLQFSNFLPPFLDITENVDDEVSLNVSPLTIYLLHIAQFLHLHTQMFDRITSNNTTITSQTKDSGKTRSIYSHELKILLSPLDYIRLSHVAYAYQHHITKQYSANACVSYVLHAESEGEGLASELSTPVYTSPLSLMVPPAHSNVSESDATIDSDFYVYGVPLPSQSSLNVGDDSHSDNQLVNTIITQANLNNSIHHINSSSISKTSALLSHSMTNYITSLSQYNPSSVSIPKQTVPDINPVMLTEVVAVQRAKAMLLLISNHYMLYLNHMLQSDGEDCSLLLLNLAQQYITGVDANTPLHSSPVPSSNSLTHENIKNQKVIVRSSRNLIHFETLESRNDITVYFDNIISSTSFSNDNIKTNNRRNHQTKLFPTRSNAQMEMFSIVENNQHLLNQHLLNRSHISYDNPLVNHERYSTPSKSKNSDLNIDDDFIPLNHDMQTTRTRSVEPDFLDSLRNNAKHVISDFTPTSTSTSTSNSISTPTPTPTPTPMIANSSINSTSTHASTPTPTPTAPRPTTSPLLSIYHQTHSDSNSNDLPAYLVLYDNVSESTLLDNSQCIGIYAQALYELTLDSYCMSSTTVGHLIVTHLLTAKFLLLRAAVQFNCMNKESILEKEKLKLEKEYNSSISIATNCIEMANQMVHQQYILPAEYKEHNLLALLNCKECDLINLTQSLFSGTDSPSRLLLPHTSNLYDTSQNNVIAHQGLFIFAPHRDVDFFLATQYGTALQYIYKCLQHQYSTNSASLINVDSYHIPSAYGVNLGDRKGSIADILLPPSSVDYGRGLPLNNEDSNPSQVKSYTMGQSVNPLADMEGAYVHYSSTIPEQLRHNVTSSSPVSYMSPPFVTNTSYSSHNEDLHSLNNSPLLKVNSVENHLDYLLGVHLHSNSTTDVDVPIPPYAPFTKLAYDMGVYNNEAILELESNNQTDDIDIAQSIQFKTNIRKFNDSNPHHEFQTNIQPPNPYDNSFDKIQQLYEKRLRDKVKNEKILASNTKTTTTGTMNSQKTDSRRNSNKNIKSTGTLKKTEPIVDSNEVPHPQDGRINLHNNRTTSTGKSKKPSSNLNIDSQTLNTSSNPTANHSPKPQPKSDINRNKSPKPHH